MKITISELRTLVREQWYLEEYDNELTNDKSFKKKSVYVPDETKEVIKKWLKDMGLSGKSVTR